jgi:hypothetical protein
MQRLFILRIEKSILRNDNRVVDGTGGGRALAPKPRSDHPLRWSCSGFPTHVALKGIERIY